MEPGVYESIPPADYFALPYASNSALVTIWTKTPMHFILGDRQETDAMRLGTALHAATLEPEEYDRRYYIHPKCLRNTKVGKAEYAEHEEKAAGRAMLSEEEAFGVSSMRASIWDHPRASLLLKDAQRELTLVWDDEEYGVRCKARLDAFKKVNGLNIITDVKSSVNADPESFQKVIWNRNYHQQAGFYMRGAHALGLKPSTFCFIAIENQRPYVCATYRLSRVDIETGEEQAKKALKKYAECKASGRWPGYSDDIEDITIPDWAKARSI